MNKKSLAFVLSIVPLLCFSQTDEEKIKEVLNSAYVQGLHNGGPVANIRKGFHPSFNMLRLIDNEIKPLPIEEWIANVEKNRGQNQNNVEAKGKFVSITINGNAANVTLELYRSEKKIFTDYFLLYKFTEGWRIVSKTFYRYP